jgi:hypothetical protein
MKDAYEVLHQKEADLARVRRETESLALAASLLADDESSFFDPAGGGLEGQSKKPAEKAIASVPSDAEATGTDSPSPGARRTGFWGSLKRRRQNL